MIGGELAIEQPAREQRLRRAPDVVRAQTRDAPVRAERGSGRQRPTQSGSRAASRRCASGRRRRPARHGAPAPAARPRAELDLPGPPVQADHVETRRCARRACAPRAAARRASSARPARERRRRAGEHATTSGEEQLHAARVPLPSAPGWQDPALIESLHCESVFRRARLGSGARRRRQRVRATASASSRSSSGPTWRSIRSRRTT